MSVWVWFAILYDVNTFLHIYLLSFGCPESFSAHEGFALVVVSRDYSLAVVCRFLVSVASLAEDHGL